MNNDTQFLTYDELEEELMEHSTVGALTLLTKLKRTVMHAVFINRKMVVYTNGGKVLDVLLVYDISADDDGMSFLVESSTQGKTQCITHSPEQLFDYPIVAFIPHKCESRLRGVKKDGIVNLHMTIPALFKVKSHVKEQKKGAVWIDPINIVNQYFPEVKL